MAFNDLYIPEPNSGCWLWTGTVDAKGYGRYDNRLAHRHSYRIATGEDIDGLVLMHKCDMPSCVNPDHLTPGTIADNNADMLAKGRQGYPNGGSFADCDLHPNAILTAALVRSFRKSGKSARELSAVTGFNRRTLADAISGKTWAALDG